MVSRNESDQFNQKSSEEVDVEPRKLTKQATSTYFESRLGFHGGYERSQLVELFEDDKIMNLKISTNEKRRLLKRREIVKSMKYIRNLGRDLRK